MEIWYTWLGYFGLICGLVAAAVLQVSIIRSAARNLPVSLDPRKLPEERDFELPDRATFQQVEHEALQGFDLTGVDVDEL